jgi:hypothetical protein
MRSTVFALLLAAACGSSDGSGADGGEPPPGADGGGGSADAGPADAAVAACADLFDTFTLDVLETHSNVCVDRATCTISGGEGCAGSVTCEYQGAGTLTEEVQFAPVDGGLHARFGSGTREHELIYRDGLMSYRIRGDIEDHHLCVFTDGETDPVFPVAGAGSCPDLTRTYRLYRLDPQSCSDSIRCGIFQHQDDACRADAFCTYPTGTTFAFADLAVETGAQSGTLVGDATTDPDYPTRYELRASGDFTSGTGGVTMLRVDYFFDDEDDEPLCTWVDP